MRTCAASMSALNSAISGHRMGCSAYAVMAVLIAAIGYQAEKGRHADIRRCFPGRNVEVSAFQFIKHLAGMGHRRHFPDLPLCFCGRAAGHAVPQGSRIAFDDLADPVVDCLIIGFART